MPLMEHARNNTVDAAKLLAMFGVVMIHLAPSTPAAELMSRIFSCFAVPFFLMISLYFFMEKAAGSGPLNISQLRLDRIYIPYAVWTVLYLALQCLKFRVEHKPFHPDLIPALFYGGSGVQMYFLPLLLLFQAQALAVLLVLREAPGRLAVILAVAGAGVYGWFGSHQDYFGFGGCLERGWLFVAAAFLLRHFQSHPTGRRVNLFLGGIIATLAVTETVLNFQAGWLAEVGGPLAGYSLAALTLNLPLAIESKAWRYLLTCSYGIFLAHVVFLETFEFAAARLGWELKPYSVITKILMPLLISACCVLLIWLVRLNPVPARFLLGEPAHRPRVSLSSPLQTVVS
jgi:peptidoglycan/LPS O-acetylase OafA/YrhL